MTTQTAYSLIAWFAAAAGRVPSTEKLVAEQDARDVERRKAERERGPRVA